MLALILVWLDIFFTELCNMWLWVKYLWHGFITACGLQAQVAFYSFLLSEWCSNSSTGALWCLSVCWGGGVSLSVSEVMGWASVVVGSAAQEASTATLLQDSSYINMSIHSGDRQTITLDASCTSAKSNCDLPQLLRTFLSSYSTPHIILCDQWPVGNKMGSIYSCFHVPVENEG